MLSRHNHQNCLFVLYIALCTATIADVSAFTVPAGLTGVSRISTLEMTTRKTTAETVESTTLLEKDASNSSSSRSRRSILTQSLISAGIVMTGGHFVLFDTPQDAVASGGATAGKYTTIPIAKRRYYGRVQQAVHEFLMMGEEVVKGDMATAKIQSFFDPEATVIVPAKRKDVNGQCTKKDGNCKGSEIRDSRYNDMKVSMYLLGNAFRTDQQKPPDRLPTVKAARAFFKEMDEMEKRVRVKKPKSSDADAQKLYVSAYDILDRYLDLVELPPLESGHYDKEFDTLVGETARIT